MPSQSSCYSWAKFLDSQNSTTNKHLEEVFRLSEEFINCSCAYYGASEIPEIRIIKSDQNESTGAYYSPEGNIYLSSGLIGFLETISKSSGKPMNKETYAFLLWTIAHELSHHIQKHLIIRKKIEGGVIGTEFDADRLAIIMLFDYIARTNWAREKSSLEIKKGMLTTLFLPMRIKASQDLEKKNVTHPPWILRILSSATTLSTAGTNGVLNEESKDAVKDLFILISDLEKAYKEKYPEDITNMDFYAKNYAENAFKDVISKFEIIRPHL